MRKSHISSLDARFRFTREERLKNRDRIQLLFKRGRAVSHSGVKLFLLENELPINRIVFTFARKYGNAVERNRSRRFSREVYRRLRPRLVTGFDMALLVYPGKDNYIGRSDQLHTLFKKAGLLIE